MSDFDLESQSGSSTSSAGSQLPPKPVGMNFGPATVSQFEREYGIRPILATSMPYHEHPHLAYQRNTLERLALKLAEEECGPNGWIGDVGSAAARVRKFSSRVHCMVPLLQPGDAQRLAEGRRNRAELCTHRWEECNCKPFDVFVFTHSAYYFPEFATWNERLSKTTTKTAFVVGHVFDEAISYFPYDEGRYEVSMNDDQPLVSMSAAGNSHLYTHRPLLWDCGGRPGDAQRSLDVTKVARSGSTYLWRVQLVDRPPAVYSGLGHLRTFVDELHRGPLQAPGTSTLARTGLAMNDLVSARIDRLYGYGRILWTCSEDIWTPVPRGAIHTVALKMLQRPRTPATFADVNHWMKDAVRDARIPPDRQLAAATIGAALAFVVNLKDEMDVAQTLAYRYESWWRVHTQLISLVPVTRTTCTLVVVAFVVTFLLTLLLIILFPEYHHLVGLVAALIWMLIFILVSCARVCARINQRLSVDTWSRSLFHDRESSSLSVLSARPSTTLFPTNPSLVEPLLPVDGHVEVVRDPHPPAHPARANELLRIGGMVFSSPVPSVHQQGAAADLVSITNRVVTENTTVDPVAFAKFSGPLKCSAELLTIRIQERPDDVFHWVKKFPRHLADKFLKAYEKVKDLEPKEYLRDLFTKIEKDKAFTRAPAPLHKPRAIVAVDDEIKVMAGPSIAKLASQVRRVWNGVDSRILYCSGLTPDQIGHVMDQFAERKGGWQEIVGLSDDFKLYDSTLQNELLGHGRSLFPRMGMSLRTHAWLTATAGRGMSAHGVKFNLGKKVDAAGREVKKVNLGSGEPDTNLVGSIINALAHESGLPDFDYLMLVCGDDNLLLGTVSDLTDSVVENLCVHLRELGLSPTPIFSRHRYDWEFCSKLMWYGVDPKTGTTHTVLGPKPGRLLTRVGWNLTVPGAANFRGALLGLKQDCSHIPFLREYIARGLELSSAQKVVMGREYHELKHVSHEFAPSVLNMTFIQERYGVNETHCHEFLAVLGSAQSLPVVLSFPWLEQMYERDL